MYINLTVPISRRVFCTNYELMCTVVFETHSFDRHVENKKN
jgi:hypothetical protein